MGVYRCPYCQLDSAGNHAWDCPMNPVNMNNGEWQLNNLVQPKLNYYHASWLGIALNNFMKRKDVIHTIPIDKTVGSFIKENAKKELDEIVDI